MINKIKQSIAYILIGILGIVGLAKSAGSSQDAVPKEQVAVRMQYQKS